MPPGLHEIRAQTVEGPLLVQLRHRRGAAVLDGLGQRAAGKDHKLIQVHTIQRQRTEQLQIGLPGFKRLARQSVDKVHYNGGVAQGGQLFQRGADVVLRVQTTNGAPQIRLEALNTNGKPVGPGLNASGGLFSRKAVNAPFNGNFAVFSQGIVLTNGG